MAGTRVAHLEVRLVAEHPQVVGDGQLGDGLHLFGAALRRKWVLQVVVDEGLGARCDVRGEVLEVEREAGGCFDVAVRHSGAAVVLDLAFVDRVTGVGVEHLVARFHHGLDELSDHRFAAGLHHDVGGCEREPPARTDVVGERLAQRCDAGGGAVSGAAVGDGPVHRFDDVGRRGQVHVAEVEREDLVPLGGPVGGSQRHREGGLRAEVVEA